MKNKAELPEFFFELETSNDILDITPQYNIYIEGCSGCGKTHYLIKHFIPQSIVRQYSGLLYDYNGTYNNQPILSTIAYNSFQYYKDNFPDSPNHLSLSFINFSDLTRTSRVNLLSTRYLSSPMDRLIIDQLSKTILNNIMPFSFKQSLELFDSSDKLFFWRSFHVQFLSSILYKLYKNHSSEGYNTLPHALSICFSNIIGVAKWLKSDPEIYRIYSQMLDLIIHRGEKNILPFPEAFPNSLLLLNENVYWILSKDDLDLDISNPNKPTFLCIANSPEIKNSFSPAIASIISIIMNQMNNKNKFRSVFIIDELPSINIYGLDRFMFTSRKHDVSSIIAIQYYEQLLASYDAKISSTIKSSCGNHFYGKTSDDNTCVEASSLYNDCTLNKIDPVAIRNQNVGHFCGISYNSNPNHFFSDFKPFPTHELENKPIPSFALHPTNGGESMDFDTFSKHVSDNFKRINEDVKNLLNPYLNL